MFEEKKFTSIHTAMPDQDASTDDDEDDSTSTDK